jgi:peptidoglycan/xylan/chitin deacetylase (PgdA/CDA1 family)
VTRRPFPRGVCVVSIDTEMAWGEAHRRGAGPGGGHRRDDGGERAAIGAVLDLLARHGIAATWAVVGHLFLDHCDRPAGSGQRPHPEVVRPDFPWLAGDWFDVDPCSSRGQAPAWYGRDILASIRACPVPQEVGCHSFAHVMAGEPGCSRAAFDSDLAACRVLAGADGVALRSFVYPRNSIGHVEALAPQGFSAFRGPPAAPFAGRSPAARRALRLVDRVRPLSGSAVTAERHPAGVWNVPQTFLFAPAERRARLPVAVWTRAPRARLRQAARERSLFHLWFHPYNITADAGRALAALDRVCAEVARLRDAGRLDVLTMGALADRLDAATPAAAGT